MLNNNFSNTQLASAFVPQKDSYYAHDDTDVFFLFLFQLNFDIFLGRLFDLCLFLLQKYFDMLFLVFMCRKK